MKTPTFVVAAALLATPALAQTTTAPQQNAPAATNQTMNKPATGQWRASKLIGVDVYNLFNNDAVRTFQDNFDVTDNPTTPVVEQWGQATGLLSPRFVRLSVQFDF